MIAKLPPIEIAPKKRKKKLKMVNKPIYMTNIENVKCIKSNKKWKMFKIIHPKVKEIANRLSINALKTKNNISIDKRERKKYIGNLPPPPPPPPPSDYIHIFSFYLENIKLCIEYDYIESQAQVSLFINDNEIDINFFERRFLRKKAFKVIHQSTKSKYGKNRELLDK